jgi:hypothetical protein
MADLERVAPWTPTTLDYQNQTFRCALGVLEDLATKKGQTWHQAVRELVQHMTPRRRKKSFMPSEVTNSLHTQVRSRRMMKMMVLSIIDFKLLN